MSCPTRFRSSAERPVLSQSRTGSPPPSVRKKIAGTRFRGFSGTVAVYHERYTHGHSRFLPDSIPKLACDTERTRSRVLRQLGRQRELAAWPDIGALHRCGLRESEMSGPLLRSARATRSALDELRAQAEFKRRRSLPRGFADHRRASQVWNRPQRKSRRCGDRSRVRCAGRRPLPRTQRSPPTLREPVAG